MPNSRIEKILRGAFDEFEWEFLKQDSEFLTLCRGVNTIEEFENVYSVGCEKLKEFRKERWKKLWHQE